MPERIKFYTDEHVSRAVIEGLRRRGVDVLTTPEADMLGATDQAQLDLAAIQGRVIFTQDADFLRLHSKGRDHGGIIYAAQSTNAGELIRGLVLIYQILPAEDMQNHVEFL